MSSGCDLAGKDQFGEKMRRYCWLTVDNLGHLGLIDNAYVMGLETIVEVDVNGAKLMKQGREKGCDTGPVRIAVDGVRIDGFTSEKQIAALKVGKILFVDQQAEWPACGIAPHATYLAGFAPAYEAMLGQWSASK